MRKSTELLAAERRIAAAKFQGLRRTTAWDLNETTIASLENEGCVVEDCGMQLGGIARLFKISWKE